MGPHAPARLHYRVHVRPRHREPPCARVPVDGGASRSARARPTRLSPAAAVAALVVASGLLVAMRTCRSWAWTATDCAEDLSKEHLDGLEGDRSGPAAFRPRDNEPPPVLQPGSANGDGRPLLAAAPSS